MYPIGVVTGKKSNGENTRQEIKTSLIDEEQVNLLISSSKNKSQEFKNNLIKWLNSLGILKKNIISITSRQEIEFISMLEKVLEPFDIEGIKQYKVLSYKIDYYIPKLKIAIEYDENDHKNYTYEKNEGRQLEIEKELDCRFIRVTDLDSSLWNIGFILKEIIKIN